jgi:aminopeptidase N
MITLRVLMVALVLQAPVAAGVAAQADSSAPAHVPTHYEITLVPSDAGAHMLAEVETSWRLGSTAPVVAELDSTFRVVRVLVDGKPNTRISRTMYARGPGDVLVPHEKPAGDTLTTRIRYHGIPRGGLRAGPNRYGARTLVAEAATVDPAFWLPVPEPTLRTASVAFRVQADSGGRAIANGVLVRVDTLAYGHTTWHYRLDQPIPLSAVIAAAGPYATAMLPQQACTPACAPVSVWTWSGDSAFAARGPFRRAAGMMEFFTRSLGPLPYPTLAHVEATIPTAVVSGASVILYAESGYADSTLDEAVVARETARQWLRPGAPDSAAEYLATLWRSSAEGKATKPPDLAPVRDFLRSP